MFLFSTREVVSGLLSASLQIHVAVLSGCKFAWQRLSLHNSGTTARREPAAPFAVWLYSRGLLSPRLVAHSRSWKSQRALAKVSAEIPEQHEDPGRFTPMAPLMARTPGWAAPRVPTTPALLPGLPGNSCGSRLGAPNRATFSRSKAESVFLKVLQKKKTA